MSDSIESEYAATKSELQYLRWIFGWTLPVGWLTITFLIGGVGYFLQMPYSFGLVGLVLGLPVWYVNTRYINRHYESLRDGYLEDVLTFGPQVLKAAGADDLDVFQLVVWPEDTPLLVESPKQYDATLLGVGEERLWIYDETSLDMPFMSGTIGTDPDEVTSYAFADLESVHYDDRELEIHPAEGETFFAPSSTEPREAIDAIRKQIRHSPETEPE